MPGAAPSRVLRRARTAAALPGRVVAVEDRCAAIDAHVSARLDEMRAELARLRALLEAVVETETDVAALVGRLLGAMGERVEAVERELGLAARPARPPAPGAAGADPGGQAGTGGEP